MSADRDHPSEPPAARDDEDLGKSAVDWAVRAGRTPGVIRQTEKMLRRVRRQRALAAGVGLTVLATSVFVWRFSSPLSVPSVPASPLLAGLADVPAQFQRQVLADGSIVELKSGAQIAVDFAPTIRRVILQRGEAHFDVMKDRTRPFVVLAGGIVARAVGTRFSVELGQSAVEVLVTEGEVAVERPRNANGDSLYSQSAEVIASVTRGSRVIVALAAAPPTPPVEAKLSESEVEQKLSWRVPRLELAAAPLSSALLRFNLYLAPRRIVLADPALGGLQISGVLRADNADALLRLLDLEFGLTSEQHGEEIILRRR